MHQAKSINRKYQWCTLNFEFFVSNRHRASPILKLSILNSLECLEIELIRMLLVSKDLPWYLIVELLVPFSLDKPPAHLQVLILCFFRLTLCFLYHMNLNRLSCAFIHDFFPVLSLL